MKYAVLGATGLLGHHAARAIRAAGHDLVLIHRPSSQIQRLAYLEPECRVAEMLDHAGLERALRGLDGVIFSAGYYPSRPRRWQEEVASALGQTNPFYAACLQARVPRILYCSAARNSSACCAINPTRRAFQWWKRNFRIARRVPPGYPS